MHISAGVTRVSGNVQTMGFLSWLIVIGFTNTLGKIACLTTLDHLVHIRVIL